VLGDKHAGTPDTCGLCALPEDQFARREAVWQHALAQFVDQSGIDPDSLALSDLVPMVRSWALAGAVAQADRLLLAEAGPPPSPAPSPAPWPFRLTLFAILVCLSIICSGVWRFLV
jgi:hypothetical protein